MKNDTNTASLEPLKELKRRVDIAEKALGERFWSGRDVDSLVAERARFIDAFLGELWNHWFARDDAYALIAVGGYGRGELHPKSDIDLVILVKNRQHKTVKIEEFIRLLWDLHLDIGHSVRTVKECKREAKTDVSVVTALMERRLIAGSPRLSQDLDRALNSRFIWPSKRFFARKCDEQDQRHDKFSDVEYGLEPNIKSSPGGLRDIQTISWITNRHCATTDLSELTKLNYLTERETEVLVSGKRFLWRVRFALHLVSNRKEDQLRFEYQREIAQRFGYTDSAGMLAVERFMRDYYYWVLELREVNDILLQHFEEEIHNRGVRSKVRKLNENFQLRGNYIEVCDEQVFKRDPSALMEIFVVMANTEGIVGVRANTIRLIRDHLGLIDEDFRKDPRVSELFIALLKSPFTLVSQLTRMRRYGVLGRYIPEFGRVIGQMQHDLFHIYTVDAHTMMLIRNLRRFFMTEYQSRYPVVAEMVRKIDKVELLFIAGLFHDIGKGLSGNHSELGAATVTEFCELLNITGEDLELVVWLVREHLSLSMTAQREDISDPGVIQRFADSVKSVRHLHYLLALTVADINATNPNLWNAWRASLIYGLYGNTLQALEQDGVEDVKREAEVQQRKQDASKIAANRQLDVATLDELWRDTDESFIRHHSAEDLTEIARAINKIDVDRNPVVLIFNKYDNVPNESIHEIFVCSEDRLSLFADCANALDRLKLEIMSAYISTGNSGRCYDSFMVMSNDGAVLDDSKKDQIRQFLHRALTGQKLVTKMPRKHISRQLKQFVLPVKIDISKADRLGRANLELTTSDRPGLLALIGSIFVELGISVHEARISTLGERVEDIFVVSTNDESSFSDEAFVDHFQNVMSERINQQISHSPIHQAQPLAT